MQLTMPGFEPPRYAEVPAPAKAKPVKAIAPPDKQSQRAIVLEVLNQHGDLNSHEIAAFCRLTAREVAKRIPELIAEGFVHALLDEAGAIVWRLSPCGRRARVWSTR